MNLENPRCLSAHPLLMGGLSINVYYKLFAILFLFYKLFGLVVTPSLLSIRRAIFHEPCSRLTIISRP
jgi:hypothetical protein